MEVSPSTPTCVGRENELTQLLELHRQAESQGGRFAVLSGVSGAGKSSILNEFRSRQRLAGGVVLEGRCEPGLAFGPFVDIVDQSLRFLHEVGVEPTAHLPDLACPLGCHPLWHQHTSEELTPPSHDLAVEKRMRFFEAIAALLCDVARVRCPVIMLRGVERADRGTLELLRFVIDGAGPWSDDVTPDNALHALFVLTKRSNAGSKECERLIQTLQKHRAATTLQVGRLDVSGVRAYLQSPSVVARVLERTGGLPQAIDLLLEAPPVTPAQRVERLIDELPREAGRLIEALSVVRHPADLELLMQIGNESLDRAVRADFADSSLLTKNVVDGHILFSFARQSDREHAYAALEPSRCKELHRRCALHFREHGGKEQATLHALEAGDEKLAVSCALEDARSLAARHAHTEAASLLEEVVGKVEQVDRELLDYLVDLQRVSGNYRRAIVHAERVQAMTPSCAVAARRVGHLCTLAGQLDVAATMLSHAHQLAEGADEEVLVEVEALLAELHYQRAAYDEARDWATRALAASEGAELLLLAIHARNTLGKLALAQKDPKEAAALFQTNYELATTAELGHQRAQSLTNLGVALLRQQRLDEAERAFAQAIEVAHVANDTREHAIATENLAVLAHLGRDYATALVRYHEAVALLKRLGNRAMLARVAINLGELYLTLGDGARARGLCDFATHVSDGPLPLVEGQGLILRGRVETVDGNLNAARACHEAALASVGNRATALVHEARLELAKLALEDGDIARARSELSALPPRESSKTRAEVALVRADVARAEGSPTLSFATEAVELARLAEDESLLAPALAKLTRSLCDEHDLSAATEALHEAQEVEGRLCGRVPQEYREAFERRAQRSALAQVEALVASAEVASTTRRASTVSSLAPAWPKKRKPLNRRYKRLVGSSLAMQSLLTTLDKVAPSQTTVLIRGESGTGKELVAEAIHENSPRRGKPLIKVNCAALVESLLMSELFGHERGAFTGAKSLKKGRFELANGGTLFLDEIGDISPKMQVSLLRVLQEREFERVGGTRPIKVDVRIVAATHRDLEEMVANGTFREDLYYRLRGVTIEVAALRDRLSDLPELGDHLLSRIGEQRTEPKKSLAPESQRLLMSHRWPGNVRELENVLRSATLFAESEILVPDDFAAFSGTFVAPPEKDQKSQNHSVLPFEDLVYARVREGENSLLELKKVIERECIFRALGEAQGNITRAAGLLGMKRPRLSQLVKQYGLNVKKVKKS